MGAAFSPIQINNIGFIKKSNDINISLASTSVSTPSH